MENISKHQNRFVLKDIESVRPLFELYRDLLIENGYLEIKNWKCKFDYFDNGIRIPKLARKIYAKVLDDGKNFENPFLTSKINSFLNFLNENVDEGEPILTRLWYELYKERKDLQDAFQDVFGKDRKSYIRWLRQNLKKEYNFDKIFLPSDMLSESDQIIVNRSKIDGITGRKLIEKNSEKLHLNKIAINVSGYLKGEFGIAEAGRSYATAIKDVGIPFVLNNIDSSLHRNEDKTFNNFEEFNPNPINLIVVNADQSDVFYKKVGPKYFENKYNIGVWFWELSDFPKEWNNSFKYYDEIWVASSFIANSIAKFSPIPVVKITCPIEIDESKFVKNRSKFKLKEDNFVFLFIFDFLSVFERKNPLGVIEAFKNTFSEEENVVLVIKSINGSKSPLENKKLQQVCQRKNIILFDEHMDRDKIYSLLASSDCYVSLHRSEGHGFTIAEAMYAKKPVIATSYGGNTDFMNVNNSFPVKYNVKKLERDHGAYKKGSIWADPD
ncbi:MAG: glycosyltransferase family 4 protein, partial [Nitrosopumilus sp.]|nr:glycosyltransferase family 4 protein [Nitrosopumilus sp.]